MLNLPRVTLSHAGLRAGPIHSYIELPTALHTVLSIRRLGLCTVVHTVSTTLRVESTLRSTPSGAVHAEGPGMQWQLRILSGSTSRSSAGVSRADGPGPAWAAHWPA